MTGGRAFARSGRKLCRRRTPDECKVLVDPVALWARQVHPGEADAGTMKGLLHALDGLGLHRLVKASPVRDVVGAVPVEHGVAGNAGRTSQPCTGASGPGARLAGFL